VLSEYVLATRDKAFLDEKIGFQTPASRLQASVASTI
jgi:hypothetical protein